MAMIIQWHNCNAKPKQIRSNLYNVTKIWHLVQSFRCEKALSCYWPRECKAFFFHSSPQREPSEQPSCPLSPSIVLFFHVKDNDPTLWYSSLLRQHPVYDFILCPAPHLEECMLLCFYKWWDSLPGHMPWRCLTSFLHILPLVPFAVWWT